jgi:regulator of nonsense transcripts 2
MPHLPTVAEQTSSIGLTNGSSGRGVDVEDVTAVGKWEDEEERRFYEDLPDLKDFVPKSILGLDETEGVNGGGARELSTEEIRKKEEENDIRRLETEMENVKIEAMNDPKDEFEDK